MSKPQLFKNLSDKVRLDYIIGKPRWFIKGDGTIDLQLHTDASVNTNAKIDKLVKSLPRFIAYFGPSASGTERPQTYCFTWLDPSTTTTFRYDRLMYFSDGSLASQALGQETSVNNPNNFATFTYLGSGGITFNNEIRRTMNIVFRNCWVNDKYYGDTTWTYLSKIPNSIAVNDSVGARNFMLNPSNNWIYYGNCLWAPKEDNYNYRMKLKPSNGSIRTGSYYNSNWTVTTDSTMSNSQFRLSTNDLPKDVKKLIVDLPKPSQYAGLNVGILINTKEAGSTNWQQRLSVVQSTESSHNEIDLTSLQLEQYEDYAITISYKTVDKDLVNVYLA